MPAMRTAHGVYKLRKYSPVDLQPVESQQSLIVRRQQPSPTSPHKIFTPANTNIAPKPPKTSHKTIEFVCGEVPLKLLIKILRKHAYRCNMQHRFHTFAENIDCCYTLEVV